MFLYGFIAYLCGRNDCSTLYIDDMETLYNLTKEEAKTLINYFESDIGRLAFALWNTGKASTLESGVKRAKKIKNFANEKTL